MRRPTLTLHAYRPKASLWPVAALAGRILLGAGLGAALGMTTLHLQLWVTIGALAGWAFDALRQNTSHAA